MVARSTGSGPASMPGQLFEGRDLALTTDFRAVVGEIVVKHLGNANLKTIFPSYSAKPEEFRRFLL